MATGDVVMVTRKGHDEDLKRLVKKLKSDGRSAAIAPRRVHRPWGFYESIHDGHRFQVKRITVNPGGKLSLQKHYHRAEHWVVVNGTAMSRAMTNRSSCVKTSLSIFRLGPRIALKIQENCR